MEAPDKTYGVTPRMDGDVSQRLAWRVLALREALVTIKSATEAKTPAYETARRSLSLDDANAAAKL